MVAMNVTEDAAFQLLITLGNPPNIYSSVQAVSFMVILSPDIKPTVDIVKNHLINSSNTKVWYGCYMPDPWEGSFVQELDTAPDLELAYSMQSRDIGWDSFLIFGLAPENTSVVYAAIIAELKDCPLNDEDDYNEVGNGTAVVRTYPDDVNRYLIYYY